MVSINKLSGIKAPKFNIERIPTHIPNFDELIEGGFPIPSGILISGPAGSGKSILCQRILINNAKNGKNGLYISFENSQEDIVKEMKVFEPNVETLIYDNKIKIIQPELYDIDKLIEIIDDNIRLINAKIVVIDTITFLMSYGEDPFKIRKILHDFVTYFKRRGILLLGIHDVFNGNISEKHTVAEFVMDGVVNLFLILHQNMFIRAIAIKKMLYTNHSLKIYPVKMEPGKGLVVYPADTLFVDIGEL